MSRKLNLHLYSYTKNEKKSYFLNNTKYLETKNFFKIKNIDAFWSLKSLFKNVSKNKFEQHQDEVELTISKLKRAGVIVWMLTGDKKETAVNLAHASGINDITFVYNWLSLSVQGGFRYQ